MRMSSRLLILAVVAMLIAAACGSGTTGSQSPAGSTAASPDASVPASPDASAAASAEASPSDPPPDVLGSGGTKIVIWHRWEGAYYTAIKQIFADYATANGVQVELLLVQEVANKAQLAIPAGQGPDIIAWVNDRLGDSALSQIIQPLDALGIDKAYLSANFAPVAADAVTYKDQVYGVPESLEAMTFIYNKALISEADLPASTDEILSDSATYNAPPDKYLFVYNAKADVYAASAWFQGAGVSLVKPDGTTDVGNEASIKALDLIKQFSGVMPKDIDYGVADTLFKDGKAAMIFNGPWSIADYQAKGIDLGLTPVPTISVSGQPGAPFVGVKLLMLAAGAKNPEAAAALMKHYGSADIQAALARVNKQVPANSAAQDQVKDDPIIAGFIDQAAKGRPLPNSEFIAAMWEPFNAMIESVWTGAAEPAQAAADGAALFEEKAQDLR
jgi:arabinogalactan oligomer / maltooligosaccharide transport system substrate-binding protein